MRGETGSGGGRGGRRREGREEAGGREERKKSDGWMGGGRQAERGGRGGGRGRARWDGRRGEGELMVSGHRRGHHFMAINGWDTDVRKLKGSLLGISPGRGTYSATALYHNYLCPGVPQSPLAKASPLPFVDPPA